jgi:Uma2 family endonuclease
MPQILLDIPDEVKAQEFMQYIVPQLRFVEQATLLLEKNGVDTLETEDINSVQEPAPLYYTPKHSYTLEEIEAIAANFPKDYLWTYSDLVKYFPENLHIKVEIIHNQLFIMPSPQQIHQEVVGNLCTSVRTFVKQNKLGNVIISPFDVVLDEDNVVIPDIVFVSVSRKEILDGKKANGTPDLVVEVWSPGNSKKEREAKHRLYEEKGVNEFWSIYPQKQQVTIETLDENGKYQIYSEASESGEVHSKILEGFSISIDTIFDFEEEDN